MTYFALVEGDWTRVSAIDTTCLGLAAGIGIFWQVSKDAGVSNLLLQSIFLISYCPTCIGLIKGRLKERPAPWVLAVLAYFLMIASILADWENATWLELAYPICNGVIGNGSVAVIILVQARQSYGKD